MTAVAFSILALATGSMLVFGWQGWKRMNDSVDMQRDASLAMHVMAREVRKSSIGDITVGNNQLECVDPSGTNVSFTVSGGNLDMTKNSTLSLRLIRRQAVSLVTTKNTANRSVTLTLSSAAGDDPSQIVSTIYVRN